MRNSITINRKKFVSIVGFFIIWQILSMYFDEIVIPSPYTTIKEVFSLLRDTSFYTYLWNSIFKLFVSIFITIFLGSFMAIFMGINKGFKPYIDPILDIMLSIPPIAWIGIAIIWFGINNKPSIFITIIATFPIMFINIYEAYINIDKKLLDMCLVYKIPQKKIIFDVIIPSMKSAFKSSIITIFGLGWKLIIMSEVLMSLKGLGEILSNARMNLSTDRLFAISFLLAFIWSVINILINYIFRERSYDNKN